MIARAALAVVLAALTLPAAAAASFPGDNGRILYTGSRDGALYSVNADGSGATQLAPANAQDGAWSPDGTRVAYVASDGGRWKLSLANADGSGAHVLLPDDWQSYDDAKPAWSPDGTQLVFASTRWLNDAYRLWVVNADGTGLRRLTDGWGYAPSWSPDGTRIAYLSGDYVSVMNADGTGAHRLTAATQPESSPSWSPDGTRLVFGRYTGDWRTSNAHAIFVVNADGSGERQLTAGEWSGGQSLYEDHPVFAPDGTRILFQRNWPTGEADLYTMTPDGLDQRAVLPYGLLPDWATAPKAPPPPPAPADTTPPQIVIAKPGDGDVYTLGALANVAFSCFDETGGSGLASCTAKPAPVGDRLDTSTVGWHSLTVVATDNAGNQSALSHRYQVVYAFTGFLSPLENPPAVNTVDAGQTVPLRWSLGGRAGAGAGATVYPVPCDTFARTFGTAAAGSLSYNAQLDRYTFEWQTDKAWVGTCRVITVRLDDGSDHSAFFRFTK